MRRVERLYFVALALLTLAAAVALGYEIVQVMRPGAFGGNDLPRNLPLAAFMAFMMLAIAPGGALLLVVLAVLPVWLWSRSRARDEDVTSRSNRAHR
jgi:hypothetical protein